jgi:hypothetical protein
VTLGAILADLGSALDVTPLVDQPAVAKYLPWYVDGNRRTARLAR